MQKDGKNIKILKIPSDIGHWLLRADGGRYYEDFSFNDFVAISDNEIKLHSLKRLDKDSIAGITIDHIKKLYSDQYHEWSNQKIAHAAGRTHRFYKGIKKGDLILVPSRRSTHFLLGVITSEVYEVTEDDIKPVKEVSYSICNYHKRRNVYWVKEVARKEISDKLYWILSAHQTIFNLEEDKDYINQLLSPIYVYNNNCHGTIKINKHTNINTDEWFQLHSIIKTYSDQTDDEVFVKSNVQSPGLIEFVSNNPEIVFSIVMLLSAGVAGKINFGVFKFEGILPFIQSYKKNQKELDIMEEEYKSKQIKNERDRFELDKDKEAWKKQKETEEELRTQLQISNFDAGRVVGDQTQKDISENPGSDES